MQYELLEKIRRKFRENIRFTTSVIKKEMDQERIVEDTCENFEEEGVPYLKYGVLILGFLMQDTQ